ncbi:MAG: outer membrane lipoprotein carrier protein LolA [Verrucomicrobiota bacterium]|jgi:outer membrane lipoprotein-sorting protein
MTKEFPSTNAQISDDRADVGNPFGIRASSFFRHYVLVIRHSAKRHGQPSIFHLPSSILVGCSIAALCVAAMVARADERDVQFNRWFAAQTNLQSWSADFTQTRSLKVLSQPLVATGKVWVTVPGLFRWELGQPAQTIVLRQPDQLLIIYPRLKRVEKYSLEGVPPGPLKDALALMDASLPRDRATMEERFRLLSATATNSVLQMTLQPRSASARKFISEILIGFRTNDFSIAVTELKFADGSGLRNDFTNTVLNRPIDPALFEVKLAPDFTVVEPLRQ